jgi:hypothetical protein
MIYGNIMMDYDWLLKKMRGVGGRFEKMGFSVSFCTK